MVEQLKEWSKMIEDIPQDVLIKMDVNLLWNLNKMKRYFEEQIENESKLEEKNKIRVALIEKCKCAFCDEYCKYPNIYKPEEHDGLELWETDICNSCPMQEL